MTIYTDFPYRFSADGTTARTSYPDHVRDLLKQLVFTRPGERLTRPQFGCGLGDLLFGPLSPEIASAVKMTIEIAIQQHMVSEIADAEISVLIDGSALLITISYQLIVTGEEGHASMRAEVMI